MAPPCDMFWGRKLIGDELDAAERGYTIGDLLEGSHLSYIMTLVPQLIDVVVSDFIPPPPPSQVDLAQPSASRGKAVRTGQDRSSSRVASSDPVCF